MDNTVRRIADLILAIEAEMRRLELWEEKSPPPEALQSLAPFCHDTLQFHQWLQWVFLPKMKEIITQEKQLPASSDIYPLAEYSFKKLGKETGQLLALIKQFDQLISTGK